ncbi:MAG TPA: hypothetical protein VIK62_01095 [Verrucomicrobiae bacterium]
MAVSLRGKFISVNPRHRRLRTLTMVAAAMELKRLGLALVLGGGLV